MDILRKADETLGFLLRTKEGWGKILRGSLIAAGACIIVLCCFQCMHRFSRWADASHNEWVTKHSVQIQDAQSLKRGDIVILKGKAGACLVRDVERDYLFCMVLRGGNQLGYIQTVHFNGGDAYFVNTDHYIRFADDHEKWTSTLRELLYIDDKK